jgi:hypothetical protein
MIMSFETNRRTSWSDNHYAPYEGYDLLIKTFEKTVNCSVKATFQDGTRLAEIREEAVKPKTGLTFLPGADTPQVNQMEEIQMTTFCAAGLFVQAAGDRR